MSGSLEMELQIVVNHHIRESNLSPLGEQHILLAVEPSQPPESVFTTQWQCELRLAIPTCAFPVKLRQLKRLLKCFCMLKWDKQQVTVRSSTPAVDEAPGEAGVFVIALHSVGLAEDAGVCNVQMRRFMHPNALNTISWYPTLFSSEQER